MRQELTVIQATRRLGITLDALYKLIYAGRLPAHKDQNGRWLLPEEAVEARRRARTPRSWPTSSSVGRVGG